MISDGDLSLLNRTSNFENSWKPTAIKLEKTSSKSSESILIDTCKKVLGSWASQFGRSQDSINILLIREISNIDNTQYVSKFLLTVDHAVTFAKFMA